MSNGNRDRRSYPPNRNYQGHNRQNYNGDYSARSQPSNGTSGGSDKLLKLMIKLGDTANVKTNMTNFSIVLNNEKTQLDAIGTAMWACISQLPSKTRIYATLLAHLSPEMGVSLLTRIADRFDTALASGKWSDIKLTLRFYAELVKANLVEFDELKHIYHEFLNIKLDAHQYVVLSSLLYVGNKLSKLDPTSLSEIMRKIEEYMLSRKPLTLGILAIHHTAHKPDDVLVELWKTVSNLANAGWPVVSIPADNDMFDEHFNAITEKLKIRSPIFAADSPEKRYPFQGLPYYLFTPVNKEEYKHSMPSVHEPSSYILSDMIRDIITLYSHNHKECIAYLNRLSNVCGEPAQLFQTVMQVLTQELLRLPRSNEKSVYYAIIVVGMCKSEPENFPSSLAKAVQILFSQMDDEGGMDVECARRLAECFAIHLSNFKYKWKWTAWVEAISLPRQSIRHSFLTHLLDCCVRLSYADHIKSVLPEEFTSSESSVWDQLGPRINFKLKTGECDASLFKISQDLCGAFKIKASAERIEECMTSVREWATPKSGDLGMFYYSDIEGVCVEVFVQCLMHTGQKSFSHLLNAFERNIDSVIKYLGGAGERGVALVAHTWKTSPQFFEICVDKLTNYRVFQAKSVLGWIVGQVGFDFVYGGSGGSGGGGGGDEMMIEDEREEVYFRAVYWNVLGSVLSKVNLRVTQMRIKVKEAKQADEMMAEDGIVDQLEAAEHEAKSAYIFLCERFADSITEKAAAMDAANVDITTTDWWRWVSGGLKEVFRKFENEMSAIKFTLGATVFTDNRDARVLGIWTDATQFYDARISSTY